MSVELAHQKADKHLCVAHHRKLRIRLHPSMESSCRISCCEITIQGNKNPMSAELAHQKADKHFCVALHRKVRIRLQPFMVLQVEIFAEYYHIKRKDHTFS